MGFRIIGAPATPHPQSVVDAVRRAVESVQGIGEAHMPQWFERGVTDGAEQVLVVALGRDYTADDVMPRVLDALKRELPDGTGRK